MDFACAGETVVVRPGKVRISARSASLNFPELLMMQNKCGCSLTMGLVHALRDMERYQYKPKLPFVLCTEGLLPR